MLPGVQAGLLEWVLVKERASNGHNHHRHGRHLDAVLMLSFKEVCGHPPVNIAVNIAAAAACTPFCTNSMAP